MAAAAAVVVDEVEVVAGDLDPLDVGGEAEAEHRPRDLAQLEDVLVGDDLGQAAGRAATGAGTERARTSSKRPSRRIAQEEAPAGASASSAGQQLLVGERPLDLDSSRLGSNLVTTANGVRSCAAIGCTTPSTSARKNSPSSAIISPSSRVQRAQAEVAVLGQLGEAEVAVVGAVEQRADRRGLEEDVRVALGVQVGPPHRLDVQRPDPALVQHRASLPSAEVGRYGWACLGDFGAPGAVAARRGRARRRGGGRDRDHDGTGESNPKLTPGPIFGVIAIFVVSPARAPALRPSTCGRRPGANDRPRR